MPEVIDMTSDDDELNEHRIFFMQPGMYSSSSEDDDEMEGDRESGDMSSAESSSEDDSEGKLENDEFLTENTQFQREAVRIEPTETKRKTL